MQVDQSDAAHSTIYQGISYFFCSTGCLARFQAAPETFLESPSTRAMASKAIQPGKYTCPMHPEVVQDGPGTCPKCGMALEPMQPATHEGPDPELTAMQRRFWVGCVFTLPVFLIAMAGLIPSDELRKLLHYKMILLNWVQLALATPVVLWCGWPFFERAWLSVLNRSPNMFTLVGLGVSAAYLYSLLATVAPSLFPAGFRSATGAVEPYFDSAAVIVVLVLLGQVLELRAR